MKTITTYPSLCRTCFGAGFISDPLPTTSRLTITCPVCNGSGIIIITEESDTLYEIPVDAIKKFNDLPWVDPLWKRLEKTIYTPNKWKMERLSTGLTLRQVAAKTGLSAATISRLERKVGKGVTQFTIESLTEFYKSWREQILQGEIKK